MGSPLRTSSSSTPYYDGDDETFLTPTGVASPLPLFESKVEAKTNTEELEKKAKQLLIIKVINERISKLLSEFHWYTRIALKQTKIDLLEALKQKLESNSDNKNLDGLLDEMAKDEKLSPHLHLLWQGRTAKLLNKLQHMTSRPEDRIRYLDLEIAQLKQELVKRLFFFVRIRKQALAERLIALQKFKGLLAQPQHSTRTALMELDDSERRILNKTEKTLLAEMGSMENEGTLIISQPIATSKSVLEQKTIQVVANAALSDAVEKRIQELISKNSRSDIVDWKIRLLAALKVHLKNKSFQHTMNTMMEDVVFAAKMYLLHEGKTGKLLQRHKYLLMTQFDLFNKIDMRIAQLKRERTMPGRFFDTPIQQRIKGLLGLKVLVGIPPKELEGKISAHFSQLNIKTDVSASKKRDTSNMKALLTYDHDLYQEWDQWQKAQRILAQSSSSLACTNDSQSTNQSAQQSRQSKQ